VDPLAPLPVLIPLLAASLLVGAIAISSRLFVDSVSIAVSVAVAVIAALLVGHSGDGLSVYWFGAWEPRDGIALGISFTIEPLGAGLATFVALMFVAAFVFSSRYFVVVGPLFHVLMLVFLAAAMGFSLTGDLFNLFVFFELVSVSAYALTAYDIEEEGPLTGTLNFAVTNSVGAIMVLVGIALVYARTGALNMAQIGSSLAAGGPPDALVVGAFTLMAVGFLTKAAVVPFHFWLADTYSVAPTPVCLLLSAAMSELGLFALARVYWTMFDGVLGASSEAITVVLLVAGSLTALLGAALCFAQRHLKRMLAFATISHVGLFLIGIALLDGAGLAGTAVYVMADGAVKASLFVGVGVIQHRYASVDELELRGRGRDLPLTAGLMVIGGLALASLPPFGPFLGKAMIDHAADAAGHGWVAVVLVLSSILTGGAVLRVCGRIFRGWGAGEREADDEYHVRGGEVDPELRYRHDRVPLTMTIPTVALLVGGLALGLVPGLADATLGAAARFTDREGYAQAVLGGSASPAAGGGSAASAGGGSAASAGGVAPKFDGFGPLDWIYATTALVGAIAMAALALTRGRIRDLAGTGPAGRALRATLAGLRALHTGQVGDYVTWVVVGTALLGAIWAVTLT
jgi:multicomponent Na+:H+ antiporter subunit D